MNESGGNTAQHNAYYGPLLRQDIHQQKKCLFLSFLIYSFSTNLLGTYYDVMYDMINIINTAVCYM